MEFPFVGGKKLNVDEYLHRKFHSASFIKKKKTGVDIDVAQLVTARLVEMPGRGFKSKSGC